MNINIHGLPLRSGLSRESDYSLLNMPLPMCTQNTHKFNSPKIHYCTTNNYCTTNTLLYTNTYVSRYSSVVRDLTPVSLIRNHKSCLTLPFVLSIHVISTTVCNVCWESGHEISAQLCYIQYLSL